MLVYLDTNIVVYLIEQSPDFGPRAATLVEDLKECGHGLAVSHLVRMECKVAPLALGDLATLGDYEAFFSSTAVCILELTADVFDGAAEIRADHGIGVLDALHLAAAVAGGCEAFLTNDARLSRFPDIQIALLR